MGNIIDYLQKNGHLPFSKEPFNEVDNLVLCQLSYVDFKDIVPDVCSNKNITVKKACKAFFEKNSEKELYFSKSLLKTTPQTLKAMAKTKRFKNAKLSHYVNEIDMDSQKQFAALQIKLGDGSIYVAFRGTDDNIVSWQEAFNLSHEIVPSQIEAAKYLDRIMKKSKRNLRIGGHSKGGNLAMYASMKCSDKIKDRILEIYNNDGPGFAPEILQSDDYLKICNKIIRYTPEFSIFGTLFEYKGRSKIISSNAKGFQQHDCMNWEVSGTRFVYKDKFSKESKLVSDAISKWMNSLELDQRKDISKSLFDALRAEGIQKIYDISVQGAHSIKKILKMFTGLSKPTKAALGSLLFLFVATWRKELLSRTSLLKSNMGL